MPKIYRTTLFWYFIFYSFSNVIGAIVFGLADNFSYGELIDFALDSYLQGEYVSESKKLLYWFLVFSPFFLFPIFSIKLFSFKEFTWSFYSDSSPKVFLIATIFILGVFIAEIIISNNLGILTLSNLSGSKENYTDYILGRSEFFTSMSNRFFGYLYMTLPFLSHIAIYNVIKTKSKLFWTSISFFLITLIVIVSIGINQKAPLIIFFISIIVGISLIKKLNYLVFLIAPIVILSIVNAIQIFVQGEDGWNVLLSIFHTFFRAPSSIPFYVNYYPDKFNFVGVDFGFLSLFHIPTIDATDNADIHTVIWGQSFEQFGVTGTVAAPFHFRAFAQAGLLFSILNIFLVSTFFKLLSWVYQKFVFGDKAICHAFYTQSLIVLYFLSQTHIKDCLWSSYGIIWIFHGFLILLIVSIIFNKKIFQKKNFIS